MDYIFNTKYSCVGNDTVSFQRNIDPLALKRNLVKSENGAIICSPAVLAMMIIRLSLVAATTFIGYTSGLDGFRNIAQSFGLDVLTEDDVREVMMFTVPPLSSTPGGETGHDALVAAFEQDTQITGEQCLHLLVKRHIHCQPRRVLLGLQSMGVENQIERKATHSFLL